MVIHLCFIDQGNEIHRMCRKETDVSDASPSSESMIDSEEGLASETSVSFLHIRCISLPSIYDVH